MPAGIWKSRGHQQVLIDQQGVGRILFSTLRHNLIISFEPLISRKVLGYEQGFAADAAKLFAFIISFLLISSRWIGMLTYFRPVTRASSALIWLTLANLFTICLIPWGTAFLAENPTLPQAVSLYGFLGMLFMITTAVVERKIEIDYPGLQDWNFRITLVMAGILATSIPLAFGTVYLSFTIFVIVILSYFIPLQFRLRLFRSLLKHRADHTSNDAA